jgi:hypothetical protein
MQVALIGDVDQGARRALCGAGKTMGNPFHCRR